MLDAAKRKRLDSVRDHAAAQRQIVFAELIGEPPYFEHSDEGHQREQHQNNSANQEWDYLPVGLDRNHHGATSYDGGR